MADRSKYSVLFVCTANRCRSPMAEALLKRQAAQLGQAEDWQIQSAGTWTEPNLPVTSHSKVVMAQRGIDLGAHRSRLLTAELLHDAAVILVMTRNQQEALQTEFPEVAHKTHLLSQLIGQSCDIEDPYGGPIDEYQLCASEMERILGIGYSRLVQMAGR